VPDLEDFPSRRFAVEPSDFRQDRIAHGFERLCDERRADDARGVARTKRHHSAAPTLGHRQREQVAHEVDDILEVVVEADSLGRISADACAILAVELRRTADAGVKACVF